MVELTGRDYERVLTLVATLLDTAMTGDHDPDTWQPRLPWPVVLAELTRSLHAPWGFVVGIDASGTTRVPAWEPVELGRRALPAMVEQAVRRRVPVTDTKLGLLLPAPAGARRLIVLGRADAAFTDHERACLDRLRPILTSLDNHFQHLQAWHTTLTRPHTARPATEGHPVALAAEHRLTPRELTVLTLLAEGLTAPAIAHRLGTTTRTTHKHLENLYRKLRTHDRLLTVLRAQTLGLLPPAGCTAQGGCERGDT
ncbi:LuxR C-terminal-related transcriptional regulator [Actinocrispum sp. NPDC049592]|uniref:helix-turn-helix transcriptional regulator n=1 Tax=Actinocrispum sp. NPDC049592 TaxID=3154835 RepID=UPI00341D436D